jgi:tRNA pseudouridine55 synthase
LRNQQLRTQYLVLMTTHGFLNIDKPAGLTSHDLVARVRRLARQKRVGHAGTLDPAATGVLVVALGAATRLIEYVQDATTKRYRAVVQLGMTTTTDDAEGEVIDTAPVPPLDSTVLEAALARFRGPIMQVPPMFSALHHQGRRLHELAREGIVVERAARPITIERLELLAWEASLITLDIMCSKGTYIRSLARDLGAALGCGAHLMALRRTAVGTFLIEDATPLAALESDSSVIMSTILAPECAVADWPLIELDATEERRIRNGQAIARAGLAAPQARAHGPDGQFLALLIREGETWRPEKVFDWTT